MILKRWRALWNHDMYHGWGRKDGYFEGWYVKVVSADQKHAYAFIPGISKGWNGETHSFVQVMDGVRHEGSYQKYSVDSFVPSESKFDTQLANNRFSKAGITLDLENIKGTLSFSEHIDWPTKLIAPGIMGWYSFVPFMQCYHGIVSLGHQIAGSLMIRGEEVDFTGGKGYMEKDWGTSFPKSWIWMQSNHFKRDTGDREAQCIMCSVAHIPWMGTHFIGFLTSFVFGDEILIFTTYNGSKMKASVDGDMIYLSFKRKNQRLEVIAQKKKGGELISPMKGNMEGKLEESLQSIINVQLFINEELRYDGQGTSSGLEIAGPYDLLLSEKWKK